MRPSVVILTYNSEQSIEQTLASVLPLSDDIHIVDSGSKDRTLAIARQMGAQVAEHPFEHYGAQRNWSIENLSLRYSWQLHLDADERLTPELREEIMALPDDPPLNGYYLPRVMTFLHRPIRHGGMYPTWHMRLFRASFGRCEARRYDQHFYLTEGESAQLHHDMIDDLQMPLTEWTVRHNRWSDAEVEEQNSRESEQRIQARWRGNPVERKRYLRSLYDRSPLFVRPFVMFAYRYFLRLGFLDGREGFIFYVLQTFWFRFLIDAKLFEGRQNKKLVPTSRRTV